MSNPLNNQPADQQQQQKQKVTAFFNNLLHQHQQQQQRPLNMPLPFPVNSGYQTINHPGNGGIYGNNVGPVGSFSFDQPSQQIPGYYNDDEPLI